MFSINLFPAGNLDIASSRLRCFFLANQLKEKNITTKISDYDFSINYDVVYIQKRITKEIVEYVLKAKSNGSLIIYDIDDYGNALHGMHLDEETTSQFFQSCDVLTVDTQERLNFLSNEPLFSRIPSKWILPDPIDYIDVTTSEFELKKTISKGELKGIWFGNALNIVHAAPYIYAAQASSFVSDFSVITNHTHIEQLKSIYPLINYESWNIDRFPNILNNSDFSVLIHDNGIEGAQKSNNKMLSSLAFGVVPLLSDTPAYRQTAEELGLEDLIILDPVDFCQKLNYPFINRWKSKIVNEEFQKSLNRWRSSFIADLFINSVRQVININSAQKGGGSVKVNLGCGNHLLQGYVNVDLVQGRAGIQPDLICDIRYLTYFPDGFADEILAVHVIEHFWFWEVVEILKEWKRVLKPGGRLVIECPNLTNAAKEFLEDPDNAAMGGVAGQRSMWPLYGDPSWQDPLMCHRWGYTPRSLSGVLTAAGFEMMALEPAQFKLREPRDMRVTAIKPD